MLVFSQTVDCWLRCCIYHVKRKKEIGNVKDIESAKGIQSYYRGQGYEGAIAGKCFCDFPVPPSLRDGCAL